MSEQVSTNGPQPDAPRRRRRATGPRAAPKPTPAFLIVQVLDEQGNPQPTAKSRLNIVSVERSAEKVLETVESGAHPNAFFVRVMVPVARNFGQRGQRNQPAAA